MGWDGIGAMWCYGRGCVEQMMTEEMMQEVAAELEAEAEAAKEATAGDVQMT